VVNPAAVPGLFRVGFKAMASRCEVMLAARDDSHAAALAQPAIDEVLRIERKYSRYLPDSVVSRINAAAGGAPLELDDETLGLLDYAGSLFANSGGLFDITSGVLRRAWDFSQPRLPRQSELAALLALVGWPKVERHGRALRLPLAGMELDVGGFGKEYAADRAAALLAAHGVRAGYVNLGGDLRVIGPMPGGAAWNIAIQDPRDPARSIASIGVIAGALATSGDYERFFEIGAQRYCHILDPRSGWPVAAWRSVSVLAPLAVAAGSHATIAMLKGTDALAFLDAAGLPYVAQDAAGRLHSAG
jgi:thiamine biosynthesis lipoprotein